MRKAYVFGRGLYFREKYSNLTKIYEIVAFLDNSVLEDDWDEKYNIPVYSPRRIKDLEEHDILCVSADFISMWCQLMELGVKESNILFGGMIKPYHQGLEEVAFGNGENIYCKNGKIVYELIDGRKFAFDTLEEFRKILRQTIREKDNYILLLSKMKTEPISRVFGSERGQAVDRFYIEKFLEENQNEICGTVMEVATNNYIQRYGGNKVKKEYILHVKGWGNNTIKGNFETGEGLSENMVDCLICTQTLQYIYDVESAMKNMYRMLRPGGCALITVPGIKSLCTRDDNNWGEKWSFSYRSMKIMCQKICDDEEYEINTYGNVKVAIAYLYGLCCEDLQEEDFKDNDKQFPFVITVKIKKVR